MQEWNARGTHFLYRISILIVDIITMVDTMDTEYTMFEDLDKSNHTLLDDVSDDEDDTMPARNKDIRDRLIKLMTIVNASTYDIQATSQSFVSEWHSLEEYLRTHKILQDKTTTKTPKTPKTITKKKNSTPRGKKKDKTDKTGTTETTETTDKEAQDKTTTPPKPKTKTNRRMIPLEERCVAKRANGGRCTRRRKHDKFCGTHMNVTDQAIVDDTNEKGVLMDMIISDVEIHGITYLADQAGYLYMPADIHNSAPEPRIIGKYARNEEGTPYIVDV